jgi:hypothetical protein
MKNLILILGVLVIGAAGVYLFTKRDATQELFTAGVPVSEEVLANTQVFMERRAVLESLAIDRSLFSDPRFTSLRSFETPIMERPVGRPNPFEPAVTPRS